VERLRGLQASPNEQRLHACLAAGSRTGNQTLWADLAALPGHRPQIDFAWHNLFPRPVICGLATHSAPAAGALYYPYRWVLALRGLV